MTTDPFAGAGVTALGLAAARAVESGRPDRLINDPFARRLFETAGRTLPMRLDWPDDSATVNAPEALHLHGSRYIGLRTRHFDDVVMTAANGGAGQVVLLGAGLDTRALRLDLPAGLSVYELDAPGVLDFKEEVLSDVADEAHCRVKRVGTDLASDWRSDLGDAGFQADLPTAWIAEGLMPYLPPTAHPTLIDVVDSCSQARATLDFDQVAGGDVGALSERAELDIESLLVSTDGIAGLAGALDDRGWVLETMGVEALADRHSRDLSDPFSEAPAAPPWLDTLFVSARRGARCH